MLSIMFFYQQYLTRFTMYYYSGQIDARKVETILTIDTRNGNNESKRCEIEIERVCFCFAVIL